MTNEQDKPVAQPMKLDDLHQALTEAAFAVEQCRLRFPDRKREEAVADTLATIQMSLGEMADGVSQLAEDRCDRLAALELILDEIWRLVLGEEPPTAEEGAAGDRYAYDPLRERCLKLKADRDDLAKKFVDMKTYAEHVEVKLERFERQADTARTLASALRFAHEALKGVRDAMVTSGRSETLSEVLKKCRSALGRAREEGL